MGAFGELLINRWGGNLDAYRGNTKSKPIVKKKTQSELTEEDKEKLEIISKASDLIVEKGKIMLTQISNNEILNHFKTTKGQNAFLKWRKSFLKKL